jgi:hypothetical protein
MGDLDTNVNINDVLQIIRFGGEGLNFALKGTVKTLKGAKKLISFSRVKYMRIKLLLHYHSKAISGEKLKGMSLHSLDKLTGGNYKVINIPTENKESLGEFFKILKKIKVAYSVLPDLVPNDGYTQIAIDPSQAEKVDAISEVFDFEKGKKLKEPVPEEKRAKEMPLEEYWENGTQKEKDKITQSAIKQAEKENDDLLKKNPELAKSKTQSTQLDVQRMLKMEKIKERHQSRDYFPVTIDKRMVVAETEKAYVTRVPHSFEKDTGNFLLMTVDKDKALKTNNGRTILTHMRKDGQTFVCDSSKSNGRMVKNQELYQKHYSKYSTEFDKKKTKVHSQNKGKEVKNIHMPKNLKK